MLAIIVIKSTLIDPPGNSSIVEFWNSFWTMEIVVSKKYLLYSNCSQIDDPWNVNNLLIKFLLHFGTQKVFPHLNTTSCDRY